MIRYFCDICGKEIDIDERHVSVVISVYSETDDDELAFLPRVLKGGQEEYLTCDDCSTALATFLNVRREAMDRGILD